MKTALPFRSISPAGGTVPVWFQGQELALPEGANLAASLLAAGIPAFRQTPVSAAPRGPFCMMGACFDCLVEIDGVTRQACMVEVAAGLRVSCGNKAEGSADDI